MGSPADCLNLVGADRACRSRSSMQGYAGPPGCLLYYFTIRREKKADLQRRLVNKDQLSQVLVPVELYV